MGLYGTGYFASSAAAYRHYKACRYITRDIDEMLAEGTIVIGKPRLLADEELVLIGGRWYRKTNYEERRATANEQ